MEIQRESQGKSDKVLSASTIRTLLNPETVQDNNQPWGLGFELGGAPGNRFIRHEGSAYFQSDMILYLHGSGIAVMTDSFGGSALADELIRSAAPIYNYPDFRPIERSAIEQDPKRLPRFVGTYGFVKVNLTTNGLTAEIPLGTAPQRLYAASPLHFFVLDGPQELVFSEDNHHGIGKVQFVTPMTRVTLKRNPSP